MPVSVKSGTFTKSGTAAGGANPSVDQTIAGIGFIPKIIIFWTSGQSTGSADHLRHGFGWTAGATQNYSLNFGSDDAATVSTTNNNTFRRASNAYCLSYTTSATLSVQAKLKTFDSDGFTLTYDNNNTSTYPIHYLAIGGTDIQSVKAGSFLPNTSPGNQDVTDPGFDPTAVFFMGINHATIPTSGTSIPHAVWFLGAAKNNTERWANAGISREVSAANSDNARLQRTDRCIVQFAEGSTTAIDMEADFEGMITNGFRINITDAPADANPIFYLAVRGGSWNLGSLVHPSTTGTQAISGMGFTPKGVFLTTIRGSAGTAIQRSHALAWGSASGTAAGNYSCVWGDDRDAQATTVTGRGSSTGALIRLVTSNTDGTTWTENCTGLLNSFDTNAGFSINWQTVDASSRQLLYAAVGDSPSGANLIKSQAPATVRFTETARRFITMRRSTLDSTLTFTETARRFLGKIKVAHGGFYFHQDFTPGHFYEPHFVMSREGVINGLIFSETAYAIKQSNQGIVSEDNLVLYYSGGASVNAATNHLSRGGSRSNNTVAKNTINAAWDDVALAEAITGETEFRCFYWYNNHPTGTAHHVKIWIDSNLPRGEVQIAKGTSAVNGVEPGPTATEEEAPSAAVEFSTAVGIESAIDIGSIPPLSHVAIWVKRIITPGDQAISNAYYTIKLDHYSDYLG